jgi:hypothetical protein
MERLPNTKFDIETVKQLKEQIEKENKYYLTPKQVIGLLDDIGVLHKQVADLMQQLATQIHYVEDVKWNLNHLIELHKKQQE